MLKYLINFSLQDLTRIDHVRSAGANETYSKCPFFAELQLLFL